jgi:hypothetical protein
LKNISRIPDMGKKCYDFSGGIVICNNVWVAQYNPETKWQKLIYIYTQRERGSHNRKKSIPESIIL